MGMRCAIAPMLVSVVLVVSTAPAAIADDSLSIEPGDGQLTFERLAPGFSKTETVTVTNDSEGAAEIALQAEITGNDENGCLRQETRDGDATCAGAGDGELGEWLDVTVSRGDATLWSGSMHELDQPQTLPETLRSGETWDLDVEVGMPIEAGNDTMTDQASFDLTIHAAADTGEESTELLGVEASTSGGSAGSSNPVEVGIHAVNAGLSALGIGGGGSKPVGLALLMLGGLLLIVLARMQFGPWRSRVAQPTGRAGRHANRAL